MNDQAQPLVTVVIPTYNHGRYLGRALQSVIDQTYTNWEIIVIDNHSADDTDEVVARFSGWDITYLKIKNNGLIAASRNVGIRAARGSWVAFLDSDDWWTKDKLQTCIEEINSEVDFIYHTLEIRNEIKYKSLRTKYIKSWQLKSPVLVDLMVRGNAISTSSVVVRKKLLEQVNGMSEKPDIVAAEDYNAWLRIAGITDKFKYLPCRLGFYQMHNKGISSLKDMSVPKQKATEDFIENLNSLECLRYNTNLKYTKARYLYLHQNFNAAKVLLSQVVKNDRSTILVKSLWMLMVIFVKNTIDHQIK